MLNQYRSYNKTSDSKISCSLKIPCRQWQETKNLYAVVNVEQYDLTL